MSPLETYIYEQIRRRVLPDTGINPAPFLIDAAVEEHQSGYRLILRFDDGREFVHIISSSVIDHRQEFLMEAATLPHWSHNRLFGFIDNLYCRCISAEREQRERRRYEREYNRIAAMEAAESMETVVRERSELERERAEFLDRRRQRHRDRLIAYAFSTEERPAPINQHRWRGDRHYGIDAFRNFESEELISHNLSPAEIRVVRQAKKADKKAEDLLKENLTPKQLDQYEMESYFDVFGNVTGTKYRIHKGCQMNVTQIHPMTNDDVCGWCFVPKGGLHAGDVMLTQKIMLERDEKKAIAEAKKFNT